MSTTGTAPRTTARTEPTVDVVLIGGGIMSATLATMLAELQPDWTVELFEAAPALAEESSNAWNNAGTGHAALCELNYTPARPDGTVAIDRAVVINEQYQASMLFWSHLVETGVLGDPSTFINPIPHVSWVHGASDTAYMRARHEAMRRHPLFAGQEFTEDRSEMEQWLPYMMAGRDPSQLVAATRAAGTDVDFGSLTRSLLAHAQDAGPGVHLAHRVTSLEWARGGWRVVVQDGADKKKYALRAKFVFVGAGGGALHLLQRSGIPEIHGFGGFPVSGQFLRTDDPAVTSQHRAKVYGKAQVGAPPMSVPHLDLRIIDGQRSLLFGPYAGFSPKFLKQGSFLDLPTSVDHRNLSAMLGVAKDNVALTRYLISQVLQSEDARFEALRDFAPTAERADWRLITAGQRVQVIKRGPDGRGVLEFGTELVTSADGSIAGLLGASPGASTAVSVMLTLLGRSFPDRLPAWRPQLEAMIPSYGRDLASDGDALDQTRARTGELLHLTS